MLEEILGNIVGFVGATSLMLLLTKILIKAISITIIVCIILILIAISKKIIKKTFEKASKKYPEKNYDAVSSVVTSIVKYIFYFFMVFQILLLFDIDLAALLIVAGVGGIIIAFAARGIIEDCITGITILIEDQFKIGDTIVIDDKTGTVESIDIRTTRLRDSDGNLHIIPNSIIKGITNMSKEFNRAVIEVSVSYSENIENVLNILTNEMESSKNVLNGLTDSPTVLGIVEMTNTCLVIKITADCVIGENWQIERELRKLIKLRFEKEGIQPPYHHTITHVGSAEK